jgi:hypothetical protein
LHLPSLNLDSGQSLTRRAILSSERRTSHSPNAPLNELRTAEVFVVASLRLRVLTHSSPEHSCPDWRQGFAEARIDRAGIWGFEALCRILVTSVLRSLDVRALDCAFLGEDEALLLQAVGLLQQGRVAEANSILRYCCPPAAARLALAPAHVFAMSLDARHLRIAPVRPGTPVSRVPVAAVSDYLIRRH